MNGRRLRVGHRTLGPAHRLDGAAAAGFHGSFASAKLQREGRSLLTPMPDGDVLQTSLKHLVVGEVPVAARSASSSSQPTRKVIGESLASPSPWEGPVKLLITTSPSRKDCASTETPRTANAATGRKHLRSGP